MAVFRVLVADDDEGVRSVLRDVLDADPRFTVVGHAATGDGVVRAVELCRPDLVLLDVRMPGGGPHLARALTRRSPAPLVVAVSADSATSTVLDMVRAGATGYLAKGRLGESLPDLVARCADGQVVLAVPNGVRVLRTLLAPSAGPEARPVVR